MSNTLFDQMVGARLKIVRKNAGFDREEAAKKLGVSAQTLYRWEAGITSLPVPALAACIKLYKTTANFLLGFEDADIDTH